jgi:hypothetical protein
MNKISKPPRALRMLNKYGAEALKPSFEGGRYRGPMVKPRVAAMVRKRAIIDGTMGSFNEEKGGWLEEWDRVRKVTIPRSPKGHIRDRTRQNRADKITRAMEGMPKKLADHKDDVESRRPERGPLHLFRNFGGVAEDKVEIKQGKRKDQRKN